MSFDQCRQISIRGAASGARMVNVSDSESKLRLAQDADRPLDLSPLTPQPLIEQRPEIFDLSQADIDRSAYFEGIPVEDYRIIAKITREIMKSADLSGYKTAKALSAFVTGEILKRLEAYPKTKEIYQKHLASPDTARLVEKKRIQLFNYALSGMSEEERTCLMKPVTDAIKRALEGGSSPEAALSSIDVQKAYFNMEQAVHNMPVYKEVLTELFSKDKLFSEIYTVQDTFRAQEMAKVSGSDTVISTFIYSYIDDKAMTRVLEQLRPEESRFIEKGMTRQMAIASGLTEEEAACLLNGVKGLETSRLWVGSFDEKSATESFLAQKPEALAAFRKLCENTKPIPELGREIYKRMLNSQLKMLQSMPDCADKQKAIQFCEKSIADIATIPDEEVGVSLVQAAYMEIKQILDGVRAVLSRTDKKYIAMQLVYANTKNTVTQKLFCHYLKDPGLKAAIGAPEWDADKLSTLSQSDFASIIMAKLNSESLTKEQKQQMMSLMMACEAAASKVPQLKALELQIGTYELAVRNEAYKSLREEIAKMPYGKSLVGICDSMIELQLNELQELFERPATNKPEKMA